MADRLFDRNNVSDSMGEVLDSHGTTFGENSAFPPTDGQSFERMLAMRGYEQAKDGVGDDILSLSLQEKKTLLSKLTTKCQEVEEPNRKALEKLCFNIVNTMFSIPNGAITFKCHLVKDVSSRERNIRAKSEDSPEMEYDSIQELKSLRTEVEKRRVLNALIMGASLTYSKIPKRFVGDLYEIDSELPKLYHDYSALNEIILYEDEVPKITEKNKYQAGMVEVRISGPGKRTLIESFGTTFPVLLCESIRGFMELFSSHGLPRKKTSADYVMKKTDNVESEYWNMVLGPEMWRIFMSGVENLDMKYLPLLFTNISELEGGEFCDVMAEILGKTRRGREILDEFIENVTDELDYEDFEDAIGLKNLNKNMISDGYLTPEDLDVI